MKIVAISDTHNQHKFLNLPKGDMLIHAGDVSSRGTKEQVLDFLDWFSKTDFKYKIFIAGNHDFYFEKENEEIVKDIIPKSIIYLNDSGIEIENIKIWGSPIQPEFYDWAFNRDRGEEIQKHWNLVPKDTDILITHGPVYGILDKTVKNDYAGCENLLKTIKIIKPKIHIFGHIHEAYGVQEAFGIKFINASLLDEKYYLKNKPISFNL